MSNSQLFTTEHILAKLVTWFNGLSSANRVVKPLDVPFYNVKVIQDPTSSTTSIIVGDTSKIVDPSLVLGEATYTWVGAKHSTDPQTAISTSFYEMSKWVRTTDGFEDAPQDGDEYVRKNAGWIKNAVTEAPEDNQYYSRKDGEWIELPENIEYYDMNAYWAEVALGPNNTMLKFYPRQHLSAPILDESHIRRDKVNSETVTLTINSTSGGWVANAIIPAGLNDGYFTSTTLTELMPSEGVTVFPTTIPANSVEGLSLTLRFKVQEDASIALLSVPVPEPVDTIYVAGQPNSNKGSFRLITPGTWSETNTISQNFINGSSASFAVSANGMYMAAIDSTGGQLVVIDSYTRAIVHTRVGIFAKALAWFPETDFLLVHDESVGGFVTIETEGWTTSAIHASAGYAMGPTINAIRLSGTGRLIAVSTNTGLTLINVPQWTKVTSIGAIPGGGNVIDAQFDPGGQLVFCIGAFGMYAFRTSNGASYPITTIETMTNITGMAWNQDIETEIQYPFLLISCTIAGQPAVRAFTADVNTIFQKSAWALASPVVASMFMAYPDNITGRQFVIVHNTGGLPTYNIYDLNNAALIRTTTLSDYSSVNAVMWHKRPGDPI